MEYTLIIAILFVLILIYFKIAERYNIIDTPNYRSAHSEVTLRGGGVVFPLAFLLFYITQAVSGGVDGYPFFIFGIGLFLLAGISFLDDILDLSSKIRLVFHFLSVTLLLYFVGVFKVVPLWWMPFLYVLAIGVLNAYNFMDGINGITGLYSLVAFLSLAIANESLAFTNTDFIWYPALACVVFLFFNFRKRAKTFMGDIGSMSLAFWLIALIGLLVMSTGNLKWLLLLSVYGVETVLTIAERIILKENILQAHRRHLYQLLANEKKVDHRLISSGYAAVQTGINTVLLTTEYSTITYMVFLVLPLLVGYVCIKFWLKKQLFAT